MLETIERASESLGRWAKESLARCRAGRVDRTELATALAEVGRVARLTRSFVEDVARGGPEVAPGDRGATADDPRSRLPEWWLHAAGLLDRVRPLDDATRGSVHRLVERCFDKSPNWRDPRLWQGSLAQRRLDDLVTTLDAAEAELSTAF